MERRMLHKDGERKIVETQEALDAAIAAGWGLHREPPKPDVVPDVVIEDVAPVSADIEIPIAPTWTPDGYEPDAVDSTVPKKRGRPAKH